MHDDDSFDSGRMKPERKTRKWDILEVVLVCMLLATYGHSFLGALFFLEDPMSPRYLYSLVGARFPSLWVLLAFTAFEYCTYVIIWQHFVFLGVLGLSYAKSFHGWLREFE